MKNALVVCGGTGAHVALAVARLHVLGHALGFLRRADGQPLLFPNLYLVDQDFGDGNFEKTAWQLVRETTDAHPGRRDWRATTGRSGSPDLKVVTPLPVGSDREWARPPRDTLTGRFGSSPWLDVFLSRRQREIRYSHGMMGSPAVGSLLLRLKEFDTGEADANHDGAYRNLLNESGRIAVVGSSVGGTGASVTPTLATQLAARRAHVMAVMVMNWFRFELDGLDDETSRKANRRNRSMEENANSAFAYFGDRLAKRVATVPVGMPAGAIERRTYTSDTQQPIQESYIHGVAALCALHHFLARDSTQAGLYQMAAEDRTRLGGGTRLPGKDDFTLQDLADRAEQLAQTLEDAATAMDSSVATGWSDLWRVRPPIHTAMERFGPPTAIADALRQTVEEFRPHIVWMKKVLGVEPSAPPTRWLPREWGQQLQKRPLAPPAGGMSPEEAALELFHWTASGIAAERRGGGEPAGAAGGYWPPLVAGDSLNVAGGRAGNLIRVPDPTLHATVEGFVAPDRISQNGWPHPLAAAEHFRYAIEQGNRTAVRQLEILLAGLVTRRLELREIRPGRPGSRPALDSVVADAREEHGRDFARFRVVKKELGGEVVLGFNSPYTLLCPTPSAEDATREDAWRRLWQELTGSDESHKWRTAPASRWRYIRNEIRQIRMWIEQEKRAHEGTPPPWTSVFEHETADPSAPPGWGQMLPAYWGPDTEAPRVRIALPTRSSGNYWPETDTKRVQSEAFLAQTPSLRRVRTRAGVTFKMVDFEAPGIEHPVRGLWRKHLEHLQKSGEIAAFGYKPEQRQLALLSADRRRAAVFEDVELLTRKSIMVRDAVPMSQGPVPGSSVADGSLRYPDIPLRSRYPGLIETAEGERVLDLLRTGQPCALQRATIKGESRDRVATWELHLAGRSDIVPIQLPLTGDPHRAHWMVWPRFRAAGDRPSWRTYYIYERCSDARLHLRPLWLDPATGQTRLGDELTQEGSNPVRFRTGGRRGHSGGPPLALCLENDQSQTQLGIYLVNLESLVERDVEAEIGIDFGTSHTVAASRVNGKKRLVELPPELGHGAMLANGDRVGLTVHVSEDWDHVSADLDQAGLRARSVWMPTYSDDPTPLVRDRGLLPSELLTIQPLSALKADEIKDWVPGRDCVIPFMDMRREDLARHLLFDFKWDASSRAFQGQEPALREIYLGMVMELVMAEIIWRSLDAIPTRAALTFSYPLRTSRAQLDSFRETLRRVRKTGQESFGIELRLVDNIGIYNESRAAKGGTERFGEVCLVGDLGGGTLDLFLSANGAPGIEFEEVADSARIGGNELLGIMASRPDHFLPEGWGSGNRDVQTHLRAWMRSVGAPQLFGDGDGTAQRHHHLKLSGFALAVDGKRARELIERYFRLVTEYMARSLAAFLVRHWYTTVLEKRPGGHHDLRVLVQLRGNGWRLWPEATTYTEIQEKISRDIGGRVAELWTERAGDHNAWRGLEPLWRSVGLWTRNGAGGRGPTIAPPPCRPEGSREPNPKAAPILNVVGQSLAPDDIRSHSHALVRLDLLHEGPGRSEDGESPHPSCIRWFDRLPVETGGSNVQVELHEVEPPIQLSHPDASRRQEISDLEPERKRELNQRLRELGETTEVVFKAPIAALVWEIAFKSRRFRGDE